VGEYVRAFNRFFVLALTLAGLACGRIGYDLIDDTADTSRTDGAPHPDGTSTTTSSGGSGGADATIEAEAGSTGGEGGVEGSSDASGPTEEGPPDAPPSCPQGISFVPTSQTPLHGDADGGVPAVDDCPAGQVVVGYDVYEDVGNDLIGKLATRCGILSVSQPNCEIVVSDGATLPARGRQWNTQILHRCPTDQMMVGARMRTGSALDQISIGCAPLILTAQGATYQISFGSITWLPPIGGTGGMPAEELCPTGQVVTGSVTWSDVWVNAIAFDCSTPALVP
jgi:hypothetical protein